jgi:serine-type D-Ala-D-Ala carboxypeptidase (penicillin-binding protein 5/6)
MQGARRGRLATALAAVVATLILAPIGAAPAVAAKPAPPELPARAWVLVDADDREVLAARRPTREAPVASTTKLMTAYVAREKLGLGKTVVAPAYFANAAESLLGLTEGERIEVRDLLYGLILASGNDAAAALAQAAGGSEEAFVRQMNRAAERLGLDDTSYANPIGLDEPGNFSSARDLVDLTLELREDRVFRKIFDTPEAVLESGARPRTVVNRNTLVRTVPYVSGVKTGYTLGAGNVLVGSAEREGVRLVSAVLGAPTESERDSATLALLNYGFSLYRRERVLSERERVATAAVRWQDETMPVVADGPVRVTVRRDQRVDVRSVAPAEVEGPIGRGQRLGRATVTVDGEPVERVALVAARSVPEATMLERFDGAIPGPRVVAWGVAVGGLALLFAAAVALWDRRRGV